MNDEEIDELANLEAKEVSTSELARIIGCSSEQIRQLTSQGVLQKLRHGAYGLMNSVQAYIIYKQRLIAGPVLDEVREYYEERLADR